MKYEKESGGETMGEANQKFQVEIETGEVMEAELLSVVEIDGKEYAVFCFDQDENPVFR